MICGQGNVKDSLLTFIKDNNLEQKVALLGQVSRNEIVDIMHKSHVYLHASETENFGLSIAEAMSCGLPTIGTLCGGPNYMLQNIYGGFPFEVDNVQQLLKQMEYVYKNYHDIDKRRISKEIKKLLF